jgi:hypothetical protein
MRRRERGGDERELQFDVRRLDVGDAVDVYVESERRWARGRFEISSEGRAFIDVAGREPIRFDSALLMGLRRVLH